VARDISRGYGAAWRPRGRLRATAAMVLAAVVMAGPAQAATAPFTYSTVARTDSAVIMAAVNSAGDRVDVTPGPRPRRGL
jgi:hypothetical protein